MSLIWCIQSSTAALPVSQKTGNKFLSCCKCPGLSLLPHRALRIAHWARLVYSDRVMATFSLISIGAVW